MLDHDRISPNLIWLIVSALLILPPIIFILIRNTVKIHRQGIVKDLAYVFHPAASEIGAARDDLIPSFEFVKYKYFLGRSGDKADSNQDDFAWWTWTAGLLMLFAVFLAYGYIVSRFMGPGYFSKLFGVTASLSASAADIVFQAWLCGLLTALAGGYVFMIRGFFRGITNFDFGPSTFVGAAINLIAGAVLISVFVFAMDLTTEAVRGGGFFVGAIVVLGFAVGQFPESASRMVMDRSKLVYFKRSNPKIYDKVAAVPVDVLDGIDSEIRDRLADHHVRSTQNLATANPLMLFVETPFGVYQIMDWVAQAQLCCAVGPDKLISLWRLGIRTLFDLERAALNETYRNNTLLLAIGAILFSDSSSDGRGGAAALPVTAELVVATIQVKLDDPHVHRLRQIYIKVGERLGAVNRRFPA